MNARDGEGREGTGRGGTGRAALLALAFGNFLVGFGMLSPAGMIAELAEGFAVSLPAAGSLLWIGSVTVAVTAPLLAGTTARYDRRLVLAGALALMGGGAVIGMLAPSFPVLIASRIMLALGAGLFTPQAATVVGYLVPTARRTQGVAFVLLGWSLAAAVGLPLAKLLATHFGWRTTLGTIAFSAACAGWAVWRIIPRGLQGAPVSLATWLQIGRHRLLTTVLAITGLMMVSQYALLTYMVPVLQHGIGADSSLCATILALFGIAGLAGNAVSTRYGGRFGPGRSVCLGVGSMAAGMILWAAGDGVTVLVTLGAVLWGLGNFSSNSMQQARLIALDPSLATASVALNSAMIYVGGALGAYFGGLVLAHDIALVPPTAAVVMVATLGLALLMIGVPRR